MKKRFYIAASILILLIVVLRITTDISSLKGFFPLDKKSDIRNRPSYSLKLNTYELIEEDSMTRVKIDFPQIEGLKNSDIQKIANKKLYQIPIKDIYTKYWETKGLNLESKYKVMESGAVLSVLYYGEPYVDGTNHPEKVCFAVNIDLESGDVLCLKDIFDFQELKNKFKGGDFFMVEGIDDIFQNEEIDTYEVLLSYYENDPIIYGDLDHQLDFYLNEERIGIIINLPHAYGDYARFEYGLR